MLEYNKEHKKFISVNLRYIQYTYDKYFIYHCYDLNRNQIRYRRGYFRKGATWIFCGISINKDVRI